MKLAEVVISIVALLFLGFASYVLGTLGMGERRGSPALPVWFGAVLLGVLVLGALLLLWRQRALGGRLNANRYSLLNGLTAGLMASLMVSMFQAYKNAPPWGWAVLAGVVVGGLVALYTRWNFPMLYKSPRRE